MRRRIAIALIAAPLAVTASWAWTSSDPPPSEQPARPVATLGIEADGDWLGGLSGIELTSDGSQFVMITDRGHIARGTIKRDGDRPVAVSIATHNLLVEEEQVKTQVPQDADWPLADAEGLAVDAQGRAFVSFEHEHRVQAYDAMDQREGDISHTRSWGALDKNKGIEALALSDEGILYAIPEGLGRRAWEAMVFYRGPDLRWLHNFTIPADSDFLPVGADFGPDGRFYVLERKFTALGFYTRVRSMTMNTQSAGDVRLLLQTARGDHGNLEGIAVWRDSTGSIRLTMVSDDNFLPFMRGELVEYVVEDGLATRGQ